jgi:hypothetical protein
MLKSRFGLDAVKTTSTDDVGAVVGRQQIPASQDLGLPGAGQQLLGTNDLVFDTVALVWCKPPKVFIDDTPRAPPATCLPQLAGGDRYVVKARGVRFWTISAPTVDMAWDEVHRLCEASDYDVRDVVLELERVDAVPVVRRRPGPILSREEVRARLLGRGAA